MTDYCVDKGVHLKPYRPYQWHWNQVEGHIEYLPSWNGEEAVQAKSIDDLPPTCLQFLDFLSRTLAPIALTTNGPRLGQRVSFLP